MLIWCTKKSDVRNNMGAFWQIYWGSGLTAHSALWRGAALPKRNKNKRAVVVFASEWASGQRSRLPKKGGRGAVLTVPFWCAGSWPGRRQGAAVGGAAFGRRGEDLGARRFAHISAALFYDVNYISTHALLHTHTRSAAHAFIRNGPATSLSLLLLGRSPPVWLCN